MATTTAHDWLNPTDTTASEYEILRDEYEILRELDQNMAYTLLPTFAYLCLLLMMGIVGNIVSFLVYRKFSPSSTRTYIMAISLVDLSTNVISYPTSMVEMGFHYTFVHAWQCRIIRFLNSAKIIASAFILVAVALDRHRRVCNSLKKQQSDRDALRAVIICIIVAVVISIPYGVMTGRATFATHVQNVTGVMCSMDDRYEGTLWHNLYQWFTGVGMITCLAIMCVSYARIAFHVSKHKKRMMAVDRTTPCHSQSSANTTLTSHLLQTTSDGSSCGSDPRDRGSDVDNKPGILLKAEAIPLSDVAITIVNDKAQVCPQLGRDPVQPANTDHCPAEDGGTKLTLARPETAKAGREHQTPSRHDDNDLKQLGSRMESGQDRPPRDAVQNCVGQLPAGDGDHEGGDSKQHHNLLTPGVPDSRCKSRSTSAGQLCSLCCLNRKAQRATREGRHAGRAKKMSSRTTLIMFLLTAIFIFSFVPYWATVTVRAAIGFDIHSMPPWLLNVSSVAVQSFFISSSVNALVYGFFSAKFREECRQLCSCTSRH